MQSRSLQPLDRLTLAAEPQLMEAKADIASVEPTATKRSITSLSEAASEQAKRSPNLSCGQKVEALRQSLERHREERQLIVVQDFPDPDGLSSAWTYKLIAQQYDIHCDIIYAGTLSHQENIALVKLTNLPAERWTVQTIKNKDLSAYQGLILIDNQGTTSQLMPFLQQAGIPTTVVIDHHKLQGNLQAEFVDIRPSVRATATILTQYLQAGLLNMDSSISEHVKCATSLMHGLRSDTNALRQAQEEDFLAAAYLSRFYDAQLLNAVLQTNRSKRVMDVIERSLKNRSVQNNFSIAGVGYLRYDNRDAIPQAADFLVTEENVHTALVYGIVHNEEEGIEMVIGSLRTTKLTLDPDEFLKEAFGQDNQGRFFGGGRMMAGGFEIPIGFLGGSNENSEYAKLKWEVFDTQIKQKLLKLINPTHDLIDSE
ncbi:bifunctional oligoribonuclease/PAP phosphatase NrnA [Planktothrix sp. FACHB-1355]|uniref:Bifunctional oligoribonuclease/PAP phosphatase NrnA n=2 Tax=Cyanophyceae TaxID=3028117 RepID=A0A926VKC1_9CYAN|nr:bifunctional oligoribonuclease/PAP phosphatase NrnA [Planktothrix sp. FACHB-1355]MBD2184019.1 bifunctional oligoribonuclease/PAP phosphatase NrnA [Aerosakkonema funiforme FACHB-1375]MBD3561902.1 bifunctional oligoribonuclease/PAP phosphatase NrnA [Planktothrix sp. FACHB-1355]